MQPRTILQIVTNSFFKLGKFSPAESIPAEDSAYALDELQGMLDGWNAEELYIFATDFLQLVLVPGVQPLTIGQGVTVTAVASDGVGTATYIGANAYAIGDSVTTGGIGGIGGVQFNQTSVLVISATALQFQTAIAGALVATTPTPTGKAIFSTPLNIIPNYVTSTPRPVKIADANIILNNVNPIVKVPLRIRDKDWWIANAVPTVTTTLPTDLYYDTLYPNGAIYLWPLQSVNYGLELEVWNNLADISDLNYQFYMPQGYWRAVTLSLAEAMVPAYGLPPQRVVSLSRDAMKARAVVRDLNSVSPRIVSADSGIPKGGMRNRSFFNYLSGQLVGPR
jgi:hypothetical protein